MTAVYPEQSGSSVLGPQAPERTPLLLLHKTGGDEHELQPIARVVAPERPIIALRGEVEEAGKLRFFRRLSPGMFDEDDIRQRAARLARTVADRVARRQLSQPIALGLSNGANMAAALLLLYPELLAGAVLVRPACPFGELPQADLAGMPVLLLAGTDDPIVSRENTDRLEHHLRTSGASVVRLNIVAGHRMVEGDVAPIRTWLGEQSNRRAA